MPFLTVTEHVSFWCGVVLMVTIVPLVASVVLATVVWEASDRLFHGPELSGLTMKIARWVNSATHGFNSKLTKRPEDSFVVNALILLGIAVPALCFYNLYYTLAFGFSWKMMYAYHVLRLGPYFMNFAYAYTMCHKECHARLGLFNDPYNAYLRNLFNWWVGLFYGVMPSSFSYGHSINHHLYNNGPLDVLSTADKPRDEFKNFVAYVPRFLLYAVNVSTVYQFLLDKKPVIAAKMVFGTLYWAAFVAAIGFLSPMFALCYLLYPLFENIVLLAVINWVWHGFVDPDDPEDTYVNSVTILEGAVNVLEEDYHVVHHQYPGEHWTNHVERYQKHIKSGEYKSHEATCFRKTHVFELFFLMILRDYKQLTAKWVDYSEKLSQEEITALIQARLRAVWWGPRADPTKVAKLKGKELGNYDIYGSGEDEAAAQRLKDAIEKKKL